MRAVAAAALLGAISLGVGCKGPNYVNGQIDGEDFREIREAIYVGEVSSESTDLQILMSTYDNACQNYQLYVQFQEYEADNALLDEEDADPRYLMFTMYLEGVEPFAENPILPGGELIGDGPSFITGRYRFANGEGRFDQLAMTDGTLTLEELDDDGVLSGSFTSELSTGDTLDGAFEAVSCDP